MKRMILIGLVVALAVIFAFGESMAAEKAKICSVKDAEQFWQFNMPDKALSCLDEVIDRDPDNAKAHFLKGKYCLAAGNYSCAEARFSAGPIRQEYGAEIASLYKAEAGKKLAGGDMKTAEEFYGQAISFNSAVKQEIVNRLFGICKEQNYSVCSLTVRIAPEMKGPIADHFASASNSVKDQDAKVDLKSTAAEYNPDKYGEEAAKDKEALGRVYLEQAKKLARQVGKEQLTEKYRVLARKYLGEGIVESELPEVVVCGPNEKKYRFPLKGGEQVDRWIIVDGHNKKYFFFAEKECQFDVLYADGYIAKKGEVTTAERSPKFKFRAYTECSQNGGIGLFVEK